MSTLIIRASPGSSTFEARKASVGHDGTRSLGKTSG